MKDISHKSLCLKLNRNFIVTDIATVSRTICDLVSGVVMALDINYKLNEDGSYNFDVVEYFNPIDWERWVTLPIRNFDLAIHSKILTVRVPTVVVTKNYDKVRFKKFSGKPSKIGLFHRDGGTDIYTGEDIELESSTIEHIVPLSRGGLDEYSNTGLTTKSTNNKKGNKTVEEAGLRLFINPYHPRPIPISSTVRKARHQDWKLFMSHKH